MTTSGICGDRDVAYNQSVTVCAPELIARIGGEHRPDAEAVASGLAGLIDQLWQGILFEGDDFDRDAAQAPVPRVSVQRFPVARGVASRPRASKPKARVGRARPGSRAALHVARVGVSQRRVSRAREGESCSLPSWQIVCHVSELAKTGDYVTFEFFGRRGFVIRDDAGTLRAFNNVCAHRAHAVVGGERGQCAKFLTCTYHGWTYHLDGRNRSVSAPDTFPKFDRSKFGLKPSSSRFMGMVFVRFRCGEPSVAERMAPHKAELAHYRIEQMVPLDDLWVHEVEIDWKNWSRITWRTTTFRWVIRASRR